MNNVVGFIRAALPIVIGGIVLWFVLAGLFALSLFVILPAFLILVAIGTFFYWRYGKMFTSATVGEIGQAMQCMDREQKGLVRFNRQMRAGGTNYHTNVNVACKTHTPIEAGETVCVESVDGKEIFVKRIGV